MPEIAPDFNHNQPTYSISEISFAVKRLLEDHFGRVRLRGEVSGWRGPHSSGHAYFSLKDEKAVIGAVCWRGQLAKLAHKPEEGLEVIATGRVSAYNGKYQLVVEDIEPAGEGALLAQLEKRRKMLEAEGLFAEERKQALPYLPQTVGVITSPTGAVIRDILHRIADRFPVRVLVWPVAVQGEGAKEQIAAAIRGFNASEIHKPDVLIVARGGGSLEDLWPFNEEIVVRAASESAIPLISAVGHETDTTLIDYVSDKRAPTPTAAAEMVVPVRSELRLTLGQLGQRQEAAMQQQFERRAEKLAGLARGLPRPAQMLEHAMQRLDDWQNRLEASLPALIDKKTQAIKLAGASLRLPPVAEYQQQLDRWREQMHKVLPAHLQQKMQNLQLAASGLRAQKLQTDMKQYHAQLADFQLRIHEAIGRKLNQKYDQLQHQAALLESVNYKKILERGFALVRDEAGRVVSSAIAASEHNTLRLSFADGDIEATPKKNRPAQADLFPPR